MASRILTLTGVAIGGCILGSLHQQWKTINLNIPFLGKFGGYKVQAEDSANFVNQKVLKRVMRLGMPKDHTDLFRDKYLIRFDHYTKSARWVMEHVNLCSLKDNDFTSQYQPDAEVPPLYQTSLEDFQGDEYELGQFVYSCYHQGNMEEVSRTFLLSNAVLLNPATSRIWDKMEKHILKLIPKYTDLYIVSGPIYNCYRNKNDNKKYVKYKMVGKNKVVVPTHLFKVIMGVYLNGATEFECFVIPNGEICEGKEKIGNYRRKFTEVQALASMSFLNGIDFENATYSKDSGA